MVNQELDGHHVLGRSEEVKVEWGFQLARLGPEATSRGPVLEPDIQPVYVFNELEYFFVFEWIIIEAQI